ncbi:MAG: hypothetical protein R3358_06665 [Woeseiaceae bacterium]|nr:hypothetical protein [Woeseiaceae bacterium]
MLELTETAKDRLHKSLAKVEGPEHDGMCFRVVPKDQKHLTLKLAKPATSDMVFTHEGDDVLALPKALQPFFENKSLDIDDNGQLMLS